MIQLDQMTTMNTSYGSDGIGKRDMSGVEWKWKNVNVFAGAVAIAKTTTAIQKMSARVNSVGVVLLGIIST